MSLLLRKRIGHHNRRNENARTTVERASFSCRLRLHLRLACGRVSYGVSPTIPVELLADKLIAGEDAQMQRALALMKGI